MTLAAFGAWPVLPYSVVEALSLGVAFWWVERRSGDWERLTVAADRVIVERALNGCSERHEFNRHWVRIELEEHGAGWGMHSRLALRFAGKAVEFGVMLPAQERVRVARELRRVLGPR